MNDEELIWVVGRIYSESLHDHRYGFDCDKI